MVQARALQRVVLRLASVPSQARLAILAKITRNAVAALAIPRCDIRLIIDCLSDDFAFQSLALQLDDYDIPLGINSQKSLPAGICSGTCSPI